MSVCPSVRMNAEISETLRARQLGLGMQIPKFLTQRKFVSAGCHAHSNIAPKTVAPTVFNTYRLTAHKLQKIVSMNEYIEETIKYRELGFQT